VLLFKPIKISIVILTKNACQQRAFEAGT